AAAAIAVYFHADYPWWLLVALALAPDLSMIGYIWGPAAGAISYDVVHTYVGPVALTAVGFVTGAEAATEVRLTWIVHLGRGPELGYGLKYRSAFKDTHLQRV